MLLPFKHCVGIKFELKCRGDEGGRWRIVHCLQSAKVLLRAVMKVTQLSSTTLLEWSSLVPRPSRGGERKAWGRGYEWRYFKYHFDMGLVNELGRS